MTQSSAGKASVAVIIPARYGSQRLQAKMLLNQTGMPMVVHVVQRAKAATLVGQVIVATDDRRVLDAVAAHGHQAILTRMDHPNGTSRVAQVAAGLGPEVDLIINVQGDEPQIEPQTIDLLVGLMRRTDAPMGTVASPMGPGEDPSDPAIVKVVLDDTGCALYFSRSPIPHDRDGTSKVRYLKHSGIYAYRRPFLAAYASLPPTPAEEAEKLEQLRVLEHGHKIAVVLGDVRSVGIDTAGQYQAFVEQYRKEVDGG